MAMAEVRGDGMIVDEFDEIKVAPLNNGGICVKELIEYLKQFPDNAEVWIGADGLSNQANYACKLDYHDIILEAR